MKKLGTCLLLASVCLFSFVGCSQKGSKSGSGSGSGSTPSATSTTKTGGEKAAAPAADKGAKDTKAADQKK